jgi:hypothetical protein
MHIEQCQGGNPSATAARAKRGNGEGPHLEREFAGYAELGRRRVVVQIGRRLRFAERVRYDRRVRGGAVSRRAAIRGAVEGAPRMARARMVVLGWRGSAPLAR